MSDESEQQGNGQMASNFDATGSRQGGEAPAPNAPETAAPVPQATVDGGASNGNPPMPPAPKSQGVADGANAAAGQPNVAEPTVAPTLGQPVGGAGESAQWTPISADAAGAKSSSSSPVIPHIPVSSPDQARDIFNGAVASSPSSTSSVFSAAASNGFGDSGSQIEDLFSETKGEGNGSSADDDGVAKGLAKIDPLTIRPRVSSSVLAIVLALLCFAGAAGVYWFGVHTVSGQNYDEISWVGLKGAVPGWFLTLSHILQTNVVILVLSLAMAVVALVVAAVRKRWWLFGQILVLGVVCYAVTWLKRLLPRPFLINTESTHANTAPSGHTLLAVGAGLALLIAVPRVWRALVAVIEATYAVAVALSLVVVRWHRPSDVVMSLLLAAGLTLLALAFTRKSGMDDPGNRVSSASIQIVASIMVTFGICSTCYAGYLFWQLYPGLDMGAKWTYGAAYASFTAVVLGLSCLLFGLVLALRQLTASPLTRLGLVGAPPAPPQK
ncbi:phosphatase PAP2 family protein [Bifidobacterium sp. ESL0790]|uniref:phosphatase PAP2 family protein n=1 Tax=Bifidobacterium sp. ESL0790 TaxID=2983233 RepID=UPI0023F6552D|nr:phosphatase PAP2 family protein [Bifidobacterium sp. ESL0790]WEV72587.1 phosphatase PAP2 family protein [Bifidobacterium sp. ESL0790]